MYLLSILPSHPSIHRLYLSQTKQQYKVMESQFTVLYCTVPVLLLVATDIFFIMCFYFYLGGATRCFD